MRQATILLREHPHYRRDAFFAGMKRAGLAVDDRPRARIRESDVLVIWNRYGVFDKHAKNFERAGATVIVTENGYLPMHGTSKTFALALGHHNGAGEYPDTEDRSGLLAVSLKPWRRHGDCMLLLPQRGIGEPGVAMPRNWLERAQAVAGKHRIRRHPGVTPKKPVEEDLDGIRYAMTWGSGAGLKTIIEGIPTFYDFPKWIGRRGGEDGRSIPNRGLMLQDVARAQWSLEEVESGEPFVRLLKAADMPKCV